MNNISFIQNISFQTLVNSLWSDEAKKKQISFNSKVILTQISQSREICTKIYVQRWWKEIIAPRLWWCGRHATAIFERTKVLKILLQEGNLSKAGCFGMSHTAAEIIESDSACITTEGPWMYAGGH